LRSVRAHLRRLAGIIFDRLFGTLRVERDELPCRYGLVEPLRANNPVRIAFHEWIALARDLWAVRNWRDAWRALFSPPSLALRHQPAGGYRRVPRLSTPRGFPG
jgi:hypothetical protein